MIYICPTVVDDVQAPVEEVDQGPLPDWAIAVVVIGLGSFAFVLIFGLSVVSDQFTGICVFKCLYITNTRFR